MPDFENKPTDRLAGEPALSKYLTKGRFAPGDRLAGRFQITRWIANGGMGEVYEARDLELDETIAVKVIRPEIATDTKVMERFRREISLARQVTHPNVCRIFDIFYHGSDDTTGSATRASAETTGADHIALLTMELLDGRTLSESLPPGARLSPEQALPIIRQMVAALGAAHEAGVVHRDFKCSNVMMVGGEEEPRVVVTDFGLARSLLAEARDARQVTQQGEILGSPAYMAPEQALGEEITAAADIYALGVVIYRMVTGRLPFDAVTPLALLAQRLNEDPLPPGQVTLDLDPRWDAAISKCLAREPEARFATVADLLVALEPESSAPSLASYRHRLRRRVAAWSLALLVIASLVFYWWHPNLQSPDARTVAPDPPVAGVSETRSSVAVLGFNNLTGRADTAWLSGAFSELLTTELAANERLRIIPGENVARMKHDLDVQRIEGMARDTLRRIGQHLGTDYVLLGSYVATGEADDSRLRLDVKLQSTVDGKTVSTLSESATEVELLSLVDRVGEGLRRQLGDEIGTGMATGVDPSIPSNLEAARLYAEGLAKLRAFDLLGARDLLLEAVARDPAYSATRAALAEAYSALGYETEAVEQIRSAFELSRDSPRQERLLIEAQYRELTSDWSGAATSYQTLFETFPDHLDYGLHLVQVQVAGGRPEDAEESLASLRRLPVPASQDPRIDLVEHRLAMALAQFPRALAAARRASEKSRELGARLLAARAKLYEGQALRNLGELTEAEAAAREAHAASLDLGDRSSAASALDLVGTVCFYRSEFEASTAAHEEALAIYRETGSRAGVFSVLNNKAITLYFLGRFEAALELREEALDIARAIGIKEKIALSLANLAYSRQALGDSAAALDLQNESLDIARQINNPQMIARRLYTIASMWMERDLNSARAKLQEAVSVFRELDQQPDLAVGLRTLAYLDLRQGDFESARRNLDASSKIDNEVEKGLRSIETRYYLAILASEEGHYDEAVERAEALAKDLENLKRGPQEAEARCVLAVAHLALGQLDAARAALDRVSELLPVGIRDSLGNHLVSIEARLLAAEGQPEAALALLDREWKRLQETERVDRRLAIELAAGEIELRHGREKAGQDRLVGLAQKADSAGFYLIARKARQFAETLQGS